MDTKKSAGEPSSQAACSPCRFTWPHRYYPGEHHTCGLSVGHEGPHVCGNPMHTGDCRTTHQPNASFTLRGEAKRNPDSGERSCSA